MWSFELPISLPTNISYQRKQLWSCIGPGRSPSLLRFRLAGRCGAMGNDDGMELVGGLDPERVPKHIAVIMDGNRRWAINRGYPVQVGHRAGAETLKRLCLSCRKFGVKVLTVFAFSTENWTRPKEEVEYLMKLFEEFIRPRLESKQRDKMDWRLSIVGNRCGLPESLQSLISTGEEVSKDNKGPHLVMAYNYGGRYEITESAKKIASKVADGVLEVEDINETIMEQHLLTNGIEYPNPDLMIRSSGELRLSNFMLWQLANSHLFFSDKLFPDFHEEDLVQAIAAYQRSPTARTHKL